MLFGHTYEEWLYYAKVGAVAIVIALWFGLMLRARRRGGPSFDMDPLEEAEVHISIGQKEQAIAILEDAVEAHPDRRKEFEAKLRELKGPPKPVSPVTKL